MASKLFGLYKPFLGEQADFLKPFEDNENKYQAAQQLWHSLESNTTIFVLILVLIGVLLAIWYYGPYNNGTGRRYRYTHWAIFLISTLVAEFGVTFFAAKMLCKTNLDEATSLFLKLSLGNLIWGGVLFFGISLIWSWLFPTKTNATPLF